MSTLQNAVIFKTSKQLSTDDGYSPKQRNWYVFIWHRSEQKQEETKTQKEAKRIEHLVQQAPAAAYGGRRDPLVGRRMFRSLLVNFVTFWRELLAPFMLLKS
jgi:hypothetical protein